MEPESVVLTQADLDAHPELVAAGLKVGDKSIPTVELEDHTIVQEDLDNNPSLVTEGVLIGDVIKLPKGLGLDAYKKPAVDESTSSLPPTNESAILPPANIEPTKKYLRGQEIISESIREVNGKTYQHVLLIDGSEQDLTEEEYADGVTVGLA